MPPSALIERGAPAQAPAGAPADEQRFGFDNDVDDLHLRLCVAGPFDRIRDECGRGGLVARFRLLLFHLADGGELALRLPPAGGGFDRARDKLLGLVDDLQALRSGPGLDPPVIVRTDTRPARERDLHALAASVGDLRVDGDRVVATCRVDTRAKIPEDGMNDYLDARPDVGRVIDTVPAARHRSRGRFRSTSAEETRPEEYAAPVLSLREYDGAVVAPRQVALHDHVVLAESFRNPVRGRLRSRTLLDWSQHFIRTPDLPEPTPLPGRWFYLDNILRGHFGHVMTEQLSHVWGWEAARRRHPDLRALMFSWPEYPVAEWELELLSAAGVPRDAITVLDAPVRVETLVATTPAYAIGQYVHPEIRPTYHRLGEALGAAAGRDGGHRAERVFLTRRSAKRSCHNAGTVEELFERHGFRVVLPEQLPLPDQVDMVRSADVVAGFAGSAMFHLALAERPTHAIVVASETYPAANERQICAFAGHSLDLVRCRSDIRTDGFSIEAFHSDYTFDAEREGALLSGWLDQL